MPVSHPAIMAKGWKGLLEEESEHQWVDISGFFVFILLGAIAIQGDRIVECGIKSGLPKIPSVAKKLGKRFRDLFFKFCLSFCLPKMLKCASILILSLSVESEPPRKQKKHAE